MDSRIGMAGGGTGTRPVICTEHRAVAKHGRNCFAGTLPASLSSPAE